MKESQISSHPSRAGETSHSKKQSCKVRIEFNHEGLQEAIAKARDEQMNEKSSRSQQWKRSLSKVVRKYSKFQEDESRINPELQLQADQPQPPIHQSILEERNGNSIVKSVSESHLYFTERARHVHEQKVKAAKEIRVKLSIKSLEKQMQSKLERKVTENAKLKEQMRLLKDIQQARDADLQLQKILREKKLRQNEFLHRGHLQIVAMIRKGRNRGYKRQLKRQQLQLSESQHELDFKRSIVNQAKAERAELLKARYDSMKQSNQKIGRSASSNIRSHLHKVKDE